MKSFAAKEKRAAPVARNRSQVSRFGHRGAESMAQQAEIHNILRSTGAQAKLRIGQLNDKYEQEADRVADQVLRMPETVEGDEIGIQPQLQGESVRLQGVAGQGSRMQDLREEVEDGEDEIPMRPALEEAGDP